MRNALQHVRAGAVVSVDALKRNPSAIFAGAEGAPIAVIRRNRTAAYVVPAAAYDAIMDRLEDAERSAVAETKIGHRAKGVRHEDQ